MPRVSGQFNIDMKENVNYYEGLLTTTAYAVAYVGGVSVASGGHL